jgi:hypothetical protein
MNKVQTDLSVISEMARRLRNAGLWDNTLGDGVAFLKDRIQLLERFGKFEGFAYDTIKRPLQTWQDCRDLLCVITSQYRTTFTDIPAGVDSCLRLAVLLDRWEKGKARMPTDIRLMLHGSIAIEWSNPAKVEILPGTI